MKKVAIIGLGYVGLPVAILAAENGYEVFGFDVDEEKILKIQKGDSTIVEPELNGRLLNILARKKIKISSKLHAANCFVIAVPTPFKREKSADLSCVFDAAKSVVEVLREGDLVILESTVPVGTTYKVASFLEKESALKAGIDFFVAHCPERVLPGRIFQELISNDRVIGGINQKSAKLARDFYATFVKGDLYLTNEKTAEMVKLVENSFRDVQIAFANQVASMACDVGVDPYGLIELTNKHPRVNVLQPGCGVGGHCIAVDPWFLVKSFPQKTKLLQVARAINDKRPNEIIEQVLSAAKIFRQKRRRKPKILILGLTFKPDVDDLRQSPALKIASNLNKKFNDLELFVYEPNVNVEKINLMKLKPIKLMDGIQNADIVVALVLHEQFKTIRESYFKNKVVIDTCGLTYKMGRSENETAFFAKRQSIIEKCSTT